MADATKTPRAKRATGFQLSKSILGKLPEAQRAGAPEHLWTKAGGICALCDQPLPSEPDLVQEGELEPDHHIPEHEGPAGATVLGNLYLAHRSCNRRRRDLPFALAHAVISFSTWADGRGRVTFDDVLSKYVSPRNENARYSRKAADVTLDFGNLVAQATVASDPATGTEYFFAEVPITHIKHDAKVQPRAIEADHVWALALDFVGHPVHEPSNARLLPVADGVAELLQFDGQHKSTAQIVLGRKTVPMKIYVEPSVPLIQDLVISIQQRIKKRPLSTSDTLAKLGDVVAERLEKYVAPEGGYRTEAGYVASQPADQRQQIKKEWLQELERLVFTDQSNKLRAYVSTRRSSDSPTTDSVVITKIIRPLIYQGLLDEDMDAGTSRDHERKAILIILNTITERLLEPGWQAGVSALLRRRAQNFFYQGAISWWMTKVLLPAILIRLEIRAADAKRPFLKALTPEREDKLRELVEAVTKWDVWSLDESTQAVKAMRSNVPRDVAAALPDYDEFRLIREVVG